MGIPQSGEHYEKHQPTTNASTPMKKRNVTYACGHRSTVQSTGTKEEHDMKVSRLDEYILCPNCELKAAHKTGKSMIEITAAFGCRKAGCAELTGSEKQILWAETIRFAHLMALDEFLCDAESGRRIFFR